MKAAEHYAEAQTLIDQLPDNTSGSFEEHAAHVEVLTTAAVHAFLAIADLLDDLTKATAKLERTTAKLERTLDKRLS